ncbi:hypothetical protein GF406_23295 [candidate division KSB1 bacterium]|nr:hypothetical protein [candidate division KSB1 bacterium]
MIRTWSTFLLCLLFLLSCSHHPGPPGRRREPAQQYVRVPLSKNLIKKYNLKEEDLTQFQYYLQDRIVLEGPTNSLTKRVTNSLQMQVVRESNMERVIFEEGIPCIIVRAWREHYFKFFSIQKFPTDIKVRVAFDDYTHLYLTFFPNDKGIYTLDLDRHGKTEFANKKYFPKNGSQNVSLLVEVIDPPPLGRENIRHIRPRSLRKY